MTRSLTERHGRNPDLILRKITIKDYTEAIQCGLGLSLGAYVVSIILADDHLIVRRGLRALLETRSDFVVCAEASDGREAVELALKHKPDVAVLDVSLPFLNGIEATRHIRKGSPATEILIFTMHDSDELIREVLHAGARGYLLKSEGDEQIVNAVGALARHHPFFSSQVSETLLDSFSTGPVPVQPCSRRASARSCSLSQKAIATRKSHGCSISASRQLRLTHRRPCGNSIFARPPNLCTMPCGKNSSRPSAFPCESGIERRARERSRHLSAIE